MSSFLFRFCFHSGLQNITFKPVKGKLRLAQRLPLADLKLTFYSDTFQPLKSNKILSLLFFFLFCREKFIHLLMTLQPFCAGYGAFTGKGRLRTLSSTLKLRKLEPKKIRQRKRPRWVYHTLTATLAAVSICIISHGVG